MTQPTPDFKFILGPNGPIAGHLGEYEHRPAQIKMAQVVWRAIQEERDALIEAGTGTGKSIAYLVPVLLSGKTLIISTANKALQSQLYEKDVPFVRDALGLDFDTVLIKGRQNYVCWRKYQVELPQQRAFAQIDGVQVYDLDELDRWVRSTDSGDLEELPIVLDGDTLANMTCPAEECLHRECLYYDRCFVMKVRQAAAEAQVVITNHHLLISDLRLRAIGGVSLPDSEVLICDEAHQIEAVATSIFETTVTDYLVPALLLRRLVRDHVPANQLDKLAEDNRTFFDRVRAAMSESAAKLVGDWEEGLRLSRTLRDVGKTLEKNNPYKGEPESEDNIRFGMTIQAVNAASDAIKAVSRGDKDGDVVRYAEQVRQRHIGLIVHAAPISAAEPLGKYLFGEHTVICTSATLSAGGNFDLFRSRCGVPENALDLIGAPVFDYQQQAMIYLPQLPTFDWQNREQYFDTVAEETARLLEVSRGRAFCLFTSWSGMEHVVDKLRETLPWPVLVQGEQPRSELLRLFKSTSHSVLFATKSFWEGVDVPGDALSLVIIDKLPFPSPNDPLHEARSEQITEQGGNAFIEYTLPIMTLNLKQGFGRLIRTKSDRGIVAILDNRLSVKRYGSGVVASLPSARVSRNFADVYRFFSVPPFDTEYALTVWLAAEEGADIHYRWRLTRLSDGKSRQGNGIAAHPLLARWAGTLAGVTQLQAAIAQGKRQAGDFKLELRLPGINGNAQTLIETMSPDLQSRLRAFQSVRVITFEDEMKT
ncbi:MAG: ATP-dependent DNA helicase [Anaerolineae bacterium]|nr:ATP-dependent DNA helicase [Anaerolineae bacterium]